MIRGFEKLKRMHEIVYDFYNRAHRQHNKQSDQPPNDVLFAFRPLFFTAGIPDEFNDSPDKNRHGNGNHRDYQRVQNLRYNFAY
jgi:hypothetical protein